jgi:hypothetical protein
VLLATPVGDALRYVAHTAGANSTANAADNRIPNVLRPPTAAATVSAAVQLTVASRGRVSGAPARITAAATRTLSTIASTDSGTTGHKPPLTV